MSLNTDVPNELQSVHNGLFTAPGVARAIGVSESTVRRALANGRIKLDYCSLPACEALFRPESVEGIRKVLRPDHPDIPEDQIAVFANKTISK